MSKEINRRQFLSYGVKVAIGAFALTACGDLLALGQNRKKTLSGIVVGSDKFIVPLDELKQSQAISFKYKNTKSILLYNDGEIRAFENICTHKDGPNRLEGNILVCQWHGATFDPLTGEAIKGPAPKGSRLPPIDIELVDGKVYLA